MAISCDPSTLANAARCFNDCTRGPVAQSIRTYLLCQIASAPPPTNPDLRDDSSFNNVFFTWTNPTPQGNTNEIWKSTDGGATFALYATVAGNVSVFHDVAVSVGFVIWSFKVRTISGGLASAFSASRSWTSGIVKTGAADVSLSFPDLVFELGAGGSGMFFDNMPNLTSFSAPLLRRVDDQMTFSGSALLATVTIPAIVSVGETNSDNFLFDNCTSLTALSVPNLTRTGGGGGNFHLIGCTALASVNFSSLVSVGGDFLLDNCTSLTVVSCPSLTGVSEALSGGFAGFVTFSFPVLFSVGTTIFLFGCTALTSINFNSLNNGGGDMTFGNCSALPSASFPALTSIIGDVIFSGCTALTSLSLPLCAFGQNFRCLNCINLVTVTLTTATFADGGFTIEFTGDKVAAGVSGAGTGINGILRRGVASATTTNDYELAGGTNAPPTAGSGTVDKATLIGAGNIVNTN